MKIRKDHHGKRKSAEYSVWADMLARCSNEKHKSYKDYGMRGITVCDRWKEFIKFYEDMGERPSSEHSIDRIDNDKGYELINCKWSTKTEQARNRRKSAINGVSWDKREKKWRTQISYVGKRITVGYFKGIEEAIKAREEAELKYWKESS